MSITLRPADRCRYDIVSLGEVMLRLDPRERRIRTAKSFDVWEGGGEYLSLIHISEPTRLYPKSRMPSSA